MSLAAHFASLGFTPADAESRAALIEAVSHGFTAFTGAPPEWRWFVPGRLEVVGKHTDYAGGHVLAGAVPRGFAMAAGPRRDRRLRVMDVANGVSADIDIDDRTSRASGWVSYLQVTARRLTANFPDAPLGLDLAFSSDLPRAAGVSSSSAIVVGTATALATRADLPRSTAWQRALCTPEDHATYCGCIESGHSFRDLTGNTGVGTHGGSEDHAAILLSRAGELGHYRFVPTRQLATVPCPVGWSFVIAVSGVHADKAGSVRERYNRAAFGARALLDVWNRTADQPAVSLAAALDSPGAVDHLRAGIERDVPEAGARAALAARLDHFLAEEAVVARAVEACRRGDASALGEAAQSSQGNAERWLGNQVAETATLARLARDLGAHGATSFGAGFGGSVWALIDHAEVAAFAGEWLEAYRHRHPGLPNVAWFAARPGPGLVSVPAGLD